MRRAATPRFGRLAPALLALVLAWPAPLGASQEPARTDRGTIQGRVTARGPSPVGDGGALPWALVEVRHAGGVRTVLTAADGRYHLPDIPSGPVVLRAHYLGHRARVVEVVVPSGGNLTLDVALTAEAVDIPGITVIADPFRVPDPDGTGPLQPVTAGADVELALLQITPGLAETAMAAGGTGRGGQDPGDPSHVLLMRGSTADLKLVLLDGAPVYTPFHLGGLLESFDAGTLGRAAHHVGGAPARYDGGLSYILDLETRRPGQDGFRLSGAADLMSAKVRGELPVGRGGVMAAGRALHNGGPRLLEGVPSPYGYVDALVRLGFPVAGGELGVTGFGNRETVRLGSESTPLAPEEAAWGNGLLSTRFSHRLGATDLRWTAAASRYNAELPLRTDSAGPINPVLARGTNARARFSLEAERPWSDGALRFGATFDRISARYASRLLTRGGVVRTESRSVGGALGVHAEAQRPLGADVVGRFGLRADHFNPGGFRAAVRASLAWSVAPGAVLSLTGGRYHQLTRAAATDVEAALVPESAGGPADGAADVLPFLDVARGDHVVMGLDQRLGSSVDLGIRGFVKRFAGVGGMERRLTSSGLDLRLQALTGERIGWLGYALSWSWENDHDTDPGSTDRFTGRHLLSAGFRGPVRGPLGVDLRVSFSDGLPYTEVPLDVSLASEDRTTAELTPVVEDDPALGASTSADDFLRLDVELYGEWSTEWAGHDGVIRPYLRIMNALDRRDALFYYFQPWRDDELQPLARKSVLPVLGVAWTF